MARTLVEEAAAAGVDAVKFQTFRDRALHPAAAIASASPGSSASGSRSTEFAELAKLAHARSLASSRPPLDLESARFLAETADCLKIASGDNDFLPLLDVAARVTASRLIVSTGLADLAAARRTVALRRERSRLARRSRAPALREQLSDAGRGGQPARDRTTRRTVSGLDDRLLGSHARARGSDARGRARRAHHREALHARQAPVGLSRPPALGRSDRAATSSSRGFARSSGCSASGEGDAGLRARRIVIAVRRSIVAAGEFPAGHRAALTRTSPGCGRATGCAPGEEGAILGRALKHDVRFGDRLTQDDVDLAMCGIAGYFGTTSDRPLDASNACLRLMHHRGPDHGRFVDFRNDRGRNACLLAHAARHHRSRRALEPAVPRRHEVDRLQRRALQLRRGQGRPARPRAAPSRPSRTPRCCSRALDERGTDALDDCEGMWAFAVYDEAAGTLTCRRDRFGEKPLYVYRDDERDLFRLGGEVHVRAARSQARAEPRSGLPLPRQRLQGALQAAATRSSKASRSCAPATFLRIGADGREEPGRYWTPLVAHPRDDMIYEEAVAGVRQRLIRSVELRLRADVPLAFCMSGGVDSLLAHLDREASARLRRARLHDRSTRTSATTSRT